MDVFDAFYFANLYKYFFIPIQFYQVYDDGVKIKLLD